MTTSFSLLASFLQMTSSQTSAPRQPCPCQKTCPAIKNDDSLYLFLRFSGKRCFDASLSWCDCRAWVFFLFSCINGINRGSGGKIIWPIWVPKSTHLYPNMIYWKFRWKKLSARYPLSVSKSTFCGSGSKGGLTCGILVDSGVVIALQVNKNDTFAT